MDANNKAKVVAVLGPTATHKSEISIELAKRLDGRIISADSMQVYKGMDIGTAKIPEEKRGGIYHYLLDIIKPQQDYCVADYVKHADSCLKDILDSKKVPIIVGGTGLYIDSFINGIVFEKEDKQKAKIRKQLEDEYKSKGHFFMVKKLEGIDPEYANIVDTKNIRRVIRGIEIYKTTGKKMSAHLKQSQQKPPRFESYKIGLNYSDRNRLYEAIDYRVDSMIKTGLIDEAKRLKEQKKLSKTAKMAIGYKEMFEYFEGECDKETAIENIKRNTKRYAKRQITWFKRDKSIKWHCVDNEKLEDIIENSRQSIVKFLNM